MSDRRSFPNTAQFRRIADAIGDEKAALLCDAMGGLEGVYVPKHPGEKNVFRTILGTKSAQRLGDTLGGGRIDIPRPHNGVYKKPLIFDAILRGEKSNAAIALEYGVAQRYVRRLRAQLRSIGCQVPAAARPLRPGRFTV
jgi:hypothetical protein